jgi:hypothetical protein
MLICYAWASIGVKFPASDCRSQLSEPSCILLVKKWDGSDNTNWNRFVYISSDNYHFPIELGKGEEMIFVIGGF